MQTHRSLGTVLAWAAKTVGADIPSNPVIFSAACVLPAACNSIADTLPTMKRFRLLPSPWLLDGEKIFVLAFSAARHARFTRGLQEQNNCVREIGIALFENEQHY